MDSNIAALYLSRNERITILVCHAEVTQAQIVGEFERSTAHPAFRQALILDSRDVSVGKLSDFAGWASFAVIAFQKGASVAFP